MITLPRTLQAWPAGDFANTLKSEIEHLDATTLRLERAINAGSYVGEQPTTVTILNVRDAGTAIEARLGIFFTEIVASCGCGAEPVEQNAYCEMRLRLAKATADAEFTVVEHHA